MKQVVRVVLSLVALLIIGYAFYSVTKPTGVHLLAGIDVRIEAEDSAQLFMNESDVLAEMNRSGLNKQGRPIDSIDTNEIENQLRTNPIFSEAEVYISPQTRRMKVRIKQREAIFLVQSLGESYYVTRERGSLPVNPHYSVYVPVVTGTLTHEYAKGELYDLIQAIEADDYFRHYFGHYYVDSKEGIILTPRVGTAKIIMGKGGDWEAMLGKLRIFNEQVISRKGWNAFEYLKLPFGDQIVAKEHTIE